MIVYEQRACTVLYNLLVCHRHAGPILLPANVCPIVPMTLHKAGRPFEFIDVSLSTLCIDQEELIARWSDSREQRPAGMVYVRTFGALFDASALFDEVKRLAPDGLIIDDRCACPPSFSPEALHPSVDAVLYSTGYAKYVDVGSGGYAVVGERTPYCRSHLPYDAGDLADVTSQSRRSISEQRPFVYADSDWLDFGEPDLAWDAYRRQIEEEARQAASAKRSINEIYVAGLPAAIQLGPRFQSWRFNIHVEDKPALMDAIAAAGLFASGHYEALDGIFATGSGRNARRATTTSASS